MCLCVCVCVAKTKFRGGKGLFSQVAGEITQTTPALIEWFSFPKSSVMFRWMFDNPRKRGDETAVGSVVVELSTRGTTESGLERPPTKKQHYRQYTTSKIAWFQTYLGYLVGRVLFVRAIFFFNFTVVACSWLSILNVLCGALCFYVPVVLEMPKPIHGWISFSSP